MKKYFTVVVPIIFYILAGLLIIYAVYVFLHCNSYIQTLIANGQLVVAGNHFDILNYFMANCAAYVFYALVLAAMGVLLHRLHRPEPLQVLPAALPAFNEKTPCSKADMQDDDFSDWTICVPDESE